MQLVDQVFPVLFQRSYFPVFIFVNPLQIVKLSFEDILLNFFLGDRLILNIHMCQDHAALDELGVDGLGIGRRLGY